MSHDLDPLRAKRLLRPDEVASFLALSRRTVYRMIRDGRMPSVKLGIGPLRIPAAAFTALFDILDLP
jgi:excisionase family DNA binding protein